MPKMMAAVVHEAGDSHVLKLESRDIPKPQKGQVLIRIKACGLNRSEMFTRQGHSPSVKFPCILGIEAVGLVEDAPGKELQTNQIVATAMGGMGEIFTVAMLNSHVCPHLKCRQSRRSSHGKFSVLCRK